MKTKGLTIRVGDPGSCEGNHNRFRGIRDQTSSAVNAGFLQEGINHQMILPGGVYACAKFEGSLFHLIHAWNWFIAVWLREHDFFVRDMHFFDEHPAPALLSRPMSWLNAIRRTFHCRLHIPISTYLMQGAIPVSRVEKSMKNQQTARSVTH
jgi:hypothetical protein